MRVSRSILTAVVVTAGLMTVGLSAVSPPSGASVPSGPSPSSAALRLVSQTTWVTDRSPFEMRVALPDPAAAASSDVTVSVYRSLQTRSGFMASQEERDLGRQIWSESAPVGASASGASLPLCVPVNIAPPPGCRAETAAHLGDGPGVYPVTVDVHHHDSGAEVAHLVTHLVLVGAQPASTPLRFALVQPVAGHEPLLPGGERSLSGSDISHLAAVQALLAGTPAITAAPDPATLAALADSSDPAAHDVLTGLHRSVTVGGGQALELLSAPFAPYAPHDMVEAGLAGEMGAQLQRGNEIVQAELGVRPAPDTWVLEGPLDHDTLDALHSVGVNRLVVPTEDVQLGVTRLTPSQPFRVDVGGSVVPALVEDAELPGDLLLPDPVLGAHELLADLAQTYFEEPSSNRGVVAVAPSSWPGDRSAADVITSGLATSPLLSAATVGQIFSGVRAASSAADAAPPGKRTELPAGRIRADRANQTELAGAVSSTLPAVGSINDLILESESDALTNGQRSAYLAGAERVLTGQLNLISVVHSSLTLTSRRATMPVSVQSLLSVPIQVRLILSSNQLQFAGGGTSVILPTQTLSHQNTTFTVPVTTRGVGSFPLQVTIATADGGLVLTTARLTIKSRAFSGVGIGLSVGALVFLALWWARELRRGRRRRT